MVKKYAFDPKHQGTYIKAKAVQERLHFKPAFEVGRALKGQNAEQAIKYLEDVIAHKRAVPFRRYNEGITHHAQGHEWGIPSARWPEKCAKLFIGLIKNALVSAASKPGVDREKLIVINVQCNRAQAYRYRRIHQAHGRVKCYSSPPTNVEIVLGEKPSTTPVA
jgi:large subunit ribosomal protein L17e